MALLAACGTAMDTPLPDPSTKTSVPPGGRPPMTAAEQKQAIDQLIAKRDSQQKQTSQ